MTDQITKTIVSPTGTNTSSGGKDAFGTTGPVLNNTFQMGQDQKATGDANRLHRNDGFKILLSAK
jgi:hypothetical protein